MKRENDKEFWGMLDEIVQKSKIVIDRPKGSRHPKYPSFQYKVDYGYLEGTSSGDGQGIDIWVGSQPEKIIRSIICTVDVKKCDSEIKILYGCTEEETTTILATHNESAYMKGILIKRDV